MTTSRGKPPPPSSSSVFPFFTFLSFINPAPPLRTTSSLFFQCILLSSFPVLPSPVFRSRSRCQPSSTKTRSWDSIESEKDWTVWQSYKWSRDGWHHEVKSIRIDWASIYLRCRFQNRQVLKLGSFCSICRTNGQNIWAPGMRKCVFG